MSNIYDIAIIGGGLGGLLSAAILSKEGFSVCLIEKNPQLGGCIQTFRRDGCIFNTGLNYTESLEEGQTLYKYFKYFGLIDKLKLRKLDTEGFEHIAFKDAEYRFAMGHDNFIETLSASFPENRNDLTNYINKLREVCTFFPLYSLDEGSPYLFDNEYHKTSASEFLNSITSNKRLANVLAGSNMLYAGVENKTPLFIHSLINYSFIDSAWRLVDGSRQLTTLLADNIKQNGGTIYNNCEVTRFVMSEGIISHVETNSHGEIRAKQYISNIHPAVTFNLIDKEFKNKTYFKRIQELDNTMAMFTLYIVMKKDAFPYMNYNYYYYDQDNVWVAGEYDEKLWPQCYVFMTHASSKSENFADSISVITYMKYDEVKKWENSFVGNRGEDYETFKLEKAEKLLNLVEQKFPGFRSKIFKFYTSSPLTYRDYTGTVDGSAYGILKDAKEPLKSVILPKTKIPNLFFTGQNINLHGILGVTITSVLTSAEFTGLNYLMNKIRNV